MANRGVKVAVTGYFFKQSLISSYLPTYHGLRESLNQVLIAIAKDVVSQINHEIFLALMTTKDGPLTTAIPPRQTSEFWYASEFLPRRVWWKSGCLIDPGYISQKLHREQANPLRELRDQKQQRRRLRSIFEVRAMSRMPLQDVLNQGLLLPSSKDLFPGALLTSCSMFSSPRLMTATSSRLTKMMSPLRVTSVISLTLVVSQ